MEEILLQLNGMDEIQAFSRLAAEYSFNIDVLQGRYLVDGKSILGLLALDSKSPVRVQVHAEGEEAAEFLSACLKWKKEVL